MKSGAKPILNNQKLGWLISSWIALAALLFTACGESAGSKTTKATVKLDDCPTFVEDATYNPTQTGAALALVDDASTDMCAGPNINNVNGECTCRNGFERSPDTNECTYQTMCTGDNEEAVNGTCQCKASHKRDDSGVCKPSFFKQLDNITKDVCQGVDCRAENKDLQDKHANKYQDFDKDQAETDRQKQKEQTQSENATPCNPPKNFQGKNTDASDSDAAGQTVHRSPATAADQGGSIEPDDASGVKKSEVGEDLTNRVRDSSAAQQKANDTLNNMDFGTQPEAQAQGSSNDTGGTCTGLASSKSQIGSASCDDPDDRRGNL